MFFLMFLSVKKVELVLIRVRILLGKYYDRKEGKEIGSVCKVYE